MIVCVFVFFFESGAANLSILLLLWWESAGKVCYTREGYESNLVLAV